MANTTSITMQRDARLLRCFSNSFYTNVAPTLGMQPFGVDLCIPPTARLDHGCIVSVSREFPPPKKR